MFSTVIDPENEDVTELANENTVADLIQAAITAVSNDLESSRARSLVVTHLETAGLWLNECVEVG